MSENKVGTSMVKATESAAIQVTPQAVKAYINAFATEQEIALFLNQCAMFGLNPFKREIYLIKYSQKDQATFVVGYEVYLKRAERTQNWAGMNSGVTFDNNGRLFSAWVDVFRKDWTNPLHHEVYLSEYIQTKEEWANGQRTGKRVPTKFWAEKPITMLKKVAIAQAFRMAFPDELAGMPYTSEEMPIDHSRLPLEEVTLKAESPATGLPEAIPGHSTGGPRGTSPDLTDPKVDPFSKENYEATKKKPLNDIKDEWSGQSFAEEIGAEVAKPDSNDFCSADKVQKIMDLVGVLVGSGIAESMVWGAIIKKVRENFNGKVAVEMSDLTEAEADWVIDYLHRWSKAAAATKKGGGK